MLSSQRVQAFIASTKRLGFSFVWKIDQWSQHSNALYVISDTPEHRHKPAFLQRLLSDNWTETVWHWYTATDMGEQEVSSVYGKYLCISGQGNKEMMHYFSAYFLSKHKPFSDLTQSNPKPSVYWFNKGLWYRNK